MKKIKKPCIITFSCVGDIARVLYGCVDDVGDASVAQLVERLIRNQ